MKKILFALICAFTVLATGCQEKEDTGITLPETEVALNSADEYQITAESPTPITYTSKDEFHATVDEQGLVTAMFVGETDIVLDNGADMKRLKVIVEPKYHLYEEPVLDFGITKDELISMLGNPYDESDNILAYTNTSSAAPITMYAFGNGKLTMSIMLVKSSYSGELGSFLGERYLLVEESDGSFAFSNAIKGSEVTMGILLQLYNLQYWMVVYMPYDATKSGAVSSDIQNLIEKFIE